MTGPVPSVRPARVRASVEVSGTGTVEVVLDGAVAASPSVRTPTAGPYGYVTAVRARRRDARGRDVRGRDVRGGAGSAGAGRAGTGARVGFTG